GSAGRDGGGPTVLNVRSTIGLAGVIGFAIIANLMLKLGASAPASDRIIFGVLSWKSVAGLVLFGCGGLLYAFLLRWVPLNVAQSFTAAQVIGGIAAASLTRHDAMSPGRGSGVGLTRARRSEEACRR